MTTKTSLGFCTLVSYAARPLGLRVRLQTGR